MKVVIIVFSPTGNTLKAGQMIEEQLISKNIEVELYNLTGKNVIFRDNNIYSYLKEKIKKHDLLCIGSPVYAHHLHYNVKNIIKSLPKPGNGWSNLAMAFVTYGGINSGVALHEAAKLLKRSGRITVLGMKINAFHSMTALPKINIKVNEGMPGKEIKPIIEELVDKIVELKETVIEKCQDITKKLDYQKRKDKMKAKIIFREKICQKFLYPKLIFDYDLCQKCAQCREACPVKCIEMTHKGPILLNEPSCIHCVACILACRYNAIDFKTNWSRWNKILEDAVDGRGPLVSNENPKSAVYF